MAEFDPDAALDAITSFLTGHRTMAGYAEFAYIVRDLHNHVSAGGRLPQRWVQAAARTAGPRPVLYELLDSLPRVKITPATITQPIIDGWYQRERSYREQIAALAAMVDPDTEGGESSG